MEGKAETEKKPMRRMKWREKEGERLQGRQKRGETVRKGRQGKEEGRERERVGENE